MKYRFWGWTPEKGSFWIGDVETEECGLYRLEYEFPCATATPTAQVVLPVTGGDSGPSINPLAAMGVLIALALCATGAVIRLVKMT